MFVVGLSSFTVASLLCAIAPDVKTLVVARILQGVAAGIQMPQVLGLIQQLSRGRSGRAPSACSAPSSASRPRSGRRSAAC